MLLSLTAGLPARCVIPGRSCLAYYPRCKVLFPWAVSDVSLRGFASLAATALQLGRPLATTVPQSGCPQAANGLPMAAGRLWPLRRFPPPLDHPRCDSLLNRSLLLGHHSPDLPSIGRGYKSYQPVLSGVCVWNCSNFLTLTKGSQDCYLYPTHLTKHSKPRGLPLTLSAYR
jgi:hypothetical protein